MTKLKLGPLQDDKPVRLTIEVSAQVHRDLLEYASLLSSETNGHVPADATRLIGPMLMRFMASDRVFTRRRRAAREQQPGGVPPMSEPNS